ncbi:MAG: nucleotide-binding universal stress UspA family protein [Arenicella sp.]
MLASSGYLSKHEVTSKYFAVRMIEQDQNVADTLLRHVENRGRDLIIIGGYGNSCFWKMVLGGMTRSLIKKSPLPVLLSH